MRFENCSTTYEDNNGKVAGAIELKLIPITFKQAKDFIEKFHRHHKPPQGWKFGIGAEQDGQLVGVVCVGRPVARMLDDGKTAEVTRLCTLGLKNVCSKLYAAAARAAQAMGYERIVTYILESETGKSLVASGWIKSIESKGGTWSRPSRKRNDKAPLDKKVRWEKAL